MLISLAQKLVVIYAVIIVMVAAGKYGLVPYLVKPLDRIKTSTGMLAAWGFASCIISGFFPNIVCAMVLTPIAYEYGKRRGVNLPALMLTLAYGIALGNDLTPMGGAGNLAAWGLVGKALGYNPGLSGWLSVMFLPSLMGIVFTAFWLWLLVYRKLPKWIVAAGCNRVKIDWAFVGKTALVLLAIYFSQAKVPFYYVIFPTVALMVTERFTWKDIKSLPWMIAIWFTVALLIGDYLATVVKSNPDYVSMIKGEYSLGKVFLVTAVLGLVTNLVSDGGITMAAMPTVLSMSGNNLWLFALVMKAIDLNYLSIMADNPMAVSCGYGGRHRDFLLIGLPILVTLILARTLFFYFTQGSSMYIF